MTASKSPTWTREGSEHWWADIDTAPRCDHCGTRLDKTDRPCPFGPHEGDAA